MVVFDDAITDVMELESRPLWGLKSQSQLRIHLKKSSGVSLLTVIPLEANLDPVRWQGILTPFGFVGTTTLSPGDWFWLWKTDWSGYYQPKYDWTKLWGRGDINVVRRFVTR
jgi:hypothetical protein